MSKQKHVAEFFKQGMRHLASGVTILTAVDKGGERVAMTASSVTSLSDSPASLLVCLNQSARLTSVIAEGDVFAVNILLARHEAISNACASPEVGDSRFAQGDWQVDPSSGLSYLTDAPAVFICQVKQCVPYGTHDIVIADIGDVLFAPAENAADSSLLVYARAGYHYI